jgi:hypothetical protein
MTSQIFKKHLPIKILFDLLEQICNKNDKFYLLNLDSYKRALFKNLLNDFINTCTEYYHSSKCKYVERKIDYKGLITIIRQICNLNKIIYTSEIKYANSKYEIIYYIYY